MKRKLDEKDTAELTAALADIRKRLLAELHSYRDEVFWLEDALGVKGHTREKKVIDRALDALQALEVKAALPEPVHHNLIIESNYDALARCSCGGWNYSFTGRKTDAEIRREFQKHAPVRFL